MTAARHKRVAPPPPETYYSAMLHGPARPCIGLLLLVILAACGSGDDVPSARDPALVTSPHQEMEATSLLGEPLYRPDLDPAVAARMDAQLDSATAAYEADGGADALIWLGRRLAYPGRYRDAIAAFSDGIDRFPEDPRFYRHRGHRYITVREFDRAIQDFERAAMLIADRPDEVEPDGQPNPAGVPLSTLNTNVWYHLGLALYLEGDFDRSARMFRTGHDVSPNDDMRVAMADWLWLALMRLGRTAEADAVLASISEDMELLENTSYHRRLLRYKSLLSDEALVGGAEGDHGASSALDSATLGYGAGAWHLIQGDTARALQLFHQVLETGSWAAFGFIAAEAEIARLRGDPVTSRE